MRWVGAIMAMAIWFWIGFGCGQAFGRTITHDNGGPVAARFAEMRGMTGVEISGVCRSACTLYLGLPETCVTPDAVLGFHGPRARSALPLPRPEFERITHQMADQYPTALRRWFMEFARYRTEGYYALSGAQVIALGARECA